MLKNAGVAAPRPTMRQVDAPSKGSVDMSETISAVEMARLTGVGRERLRTWERRHGFPVPVHASNGMRRYKVSDVRAVVSISRQVARGLDLGTAMKHALQDADVPLTLDSLGPALDSARTPAMALHGPAPLTVAWMNGVAPSRLAVGDDVLEQLPEFGPPAVSAITRLMSGELDDATTVVHEDWTGATAEPCRSVAWRLDSPASDEAMVILMQLPAAAEADALPPVASPWATAVRSARLVLETEQGVASVQHAVAALVRQTGALDGVAATVHGDGLRAASSVRGRTGSRTIPLDDTPDVHVALKTGSVRWLCEPSLREIGAPPRCEVLVVPLAAGGGTLGAMFLFYASRPALCDVSRELLKVLGTTLATALQRERATAAARAGGAAAHGSPMR